MLKSPNPRLTRSRRLRRGFVVAQIALALSLLVGAGLVGRSFANRLRLDLGFDPASVLTLDVEIPDANAERQNAFYTVLLERVRAIPGVSAAGAIYQRPLEHAGIGTDATIVIEGQSTNLADRPWEQNPRSNYQTVTPDYFRTTAYASSAAGTLPRATPECHPSTSSASVWPSACGQGRIRSANGSPVRGQRSTHKAGLCGRRSLALSKTRTTAG